MSKLVTVFCIRPMRFSHHHPNPQFECVVNRPHLANTHEHQAVLKVYVRSEGLERKVDLLPLQDELDRILGHRSAVFGYGPRSFEAIASLTGDRLRIKFPTLAGVELTADGVEGAIVAWTEDAPWA